MAVCILHTFNGGRVVWLSLLEWIQLLSMFYCIYQCFVLVFATSVWDKCILVISAWLKHRFVLFWVLSADQYYGCITGVCYRHVFMIYIYLPLYYTPVQRSWRMVYWFHLVCLSICPSVVRILSAMCIFHKTNQIRFIFTHLIKQLQYVCLVWIFVRNKKIWISPTSLNLQLWLCLL